MNYENLLIEADKLGVIVKEFKLRTVDGKCYEKLVTPEAIINSILSGIDDIYDLAEKLDVTEEILIECINHYKRKYGIYYVGKTHLLTFEPLNVIDFPN